MNYKFLYKVDSKACTTFWKINHALCLIKDSIEGYGRDISVTLVSLDRKIEFLWIPNIIHYPKPTKFEKIKHFRYYAVNWNYFTV